MLGVLAGKTMIGRARAGFSNPGSLSPRVWGDPTGSLFVERTSPSTPVSDGSFAGTLNARTGQVFAAPTDAQRPIWTANGGKPYLTFDGVNDLLSGPDLFSSIGGNHAVTLFATTRTADGSGLQAVLCGNNSAGTSDTLPLIYWNAGAIHFEFGSGAGGIVSAALGAGVTAYVVARYDGAHTKLRVNGVDSTPVAYSTANTSAGAVLVGMLQSSSFPLNGRVADFGIIDRGITDQETTDLATWLAANDF